MRTANIGPDLRLSSVRKSLLSCFSQSIFHKAGPHLASHAGVFRGARISPLKTPAGEASPHQSKRNSSTVNAKISESLLTLLANLSLRFFLPHRHMRVILWSSYLNKLSEYRKTITVSVNCENLSRTYRIVLEKLSLKRSKLYKEWAG